jgi:hypothetical protein
LLIAVALLRLLIDFRGVVQFGMAAAVAGIGGYLAFLVTIDVPMYFDRWQADLAGGKELLGIFAGLHDVSTRWAVTHDIAQWHQEIAWMSLYFSAAVWSSLALCGFVLLKHHWPRYRVNWAAPSRADTRVPVRIRPDERF